MANTTDTLTIRELEDARYDAVVGQDFDTFARLCHPDLAYSHSSGDTDTLETYLDKVRSDSTSTTRSSIPSISSESSAMSHSS